MKTSNKKGASKKMVAAKKFHDREDVKAIAKKVFDDPANECQGFLAASDGLCIYATQGNPIKGYDKDVYLIFVLDDKGKIITAFTSGEVTGEEMHVTAYNAAIATVKQVERLGKEGYVTAWQKAYLTANHPLTVDKRNSKKH